MLFAWFTNLLIMEKFQVFLNFSPYHVNMRINSSSEILLYISDYVTLKYIPSENTALRKIISICLSCGYNVGYKLRCDKVQEPIA